jgi:hypothetical protein
VSTLVLQPNAEGNHGGEYDLRSLLNLLSRHDRVELSGRLGDPSKVVVWGKTEADASRWDRIPIGARVMFYHDWTYFEVARIVWTTRNKQFSKTLWGKEAYDSKSRIADRLIFFSGFRRISLSTKKVHPLLRWDPDYPLRRFQVKRGADADRVLQLLKR